MKKAFTSWTDVAIVLAIVVFVVVQGFAIGSRVSAQSATPSARTQASNVTHAKDPGVRAGRPR